MPRNHPATASQPRRYFGIDVLRGISILVVLLLHLDIRGHFRASSWGQEPPRWLFLCLFRSGYHGVVVFFAVSGFIVTLSSLRRWPTLQEFHPLRFYRLRFARIAPLLLSVIGILALLHALGIPLYEIPAEHTSLGRTVFAALTFHINWLEYAIGQYLPANWDVMWTLAVEEGFYLVFPLVFVLLFRPTTLAGVLGIFFCFVSPWARESWMNDDPRFGGHNHLAFVDCLLLGTSTALIAFRARTPRWVQRGGGMLGLAILIGCFTRQLPALKFIGNHGFFESTLAIGACLVMLWIYHRGPEVSQWIRISLGWLASLGRYSYEIYLTHSFIVLEVSRGWTKDSRPESLGLLGWYALSIAFSYGLAMLLAQGVFDPANRWLRNRWR